MDIFLPPLRVERLPGVGNVIAGKLEKLGIQTVGNLLALDLPALEGHLGRYGLHLYELARGISRLRHVLDQLFPRLD